MNGFGEKPQNPSESQPASSDVPQKVLDERDEQAEELFQADLRKFGIDDETLDSLDSPVEIFQALLDVANIFIDQNLEEEEVSKRKYAATVANFEISERLLHSPELVSDFFYALRLESAVGIRDIEVLNKTFKEVHNLFLGLSHSHELDAEDIARGEQTAVVLNKFDEMFNQILNEKSVPGHYNYLASKNLHAVAFSGKFRGSFHLDEGELDFAAGTVGIEKIAQLDFDVFIPFEIEPGKLAIFSEDKGEIWIYDGPDSEQLKKDFQKIIDDIQYRVVGQPFAKSVAAILPEKHHECYEKFLKNAYTLDVRMVGLGERQYDELRDFYNLHQKEVRELVEDDFGFMIKDVELGRERFYFLDFLKEVTVEEAALIQNFTQHYGKIGIQTFLALEELGLQHGWVIASSAALAAQFGFKETVNKIFKKYIELNNQALKAESYLKENFGTEDQVGVHTVITDIRKRAASVYAELLAKDITTPEAEERIDTIMSKANSDALLYTSAFRTLKKDGALDLEKIKDTTFESIDDSSLFSTADVKKLYKIIELNWQNESETFISEIKNNLAAALKEGSQTTFYVLRHNGEIVGFNRFDDRRDDSKKPHIYFGSFNTDPHYGNGKLGEAIYEESLKRELKRGSVIEADCDPFSPITSKYIESGFVANEYYLYGNKPSFHIVYNAGTHINYAGTKLSTQDIIAQAESGQQTSGDTIIREIKSDDQFPELGAHRVLTRYIKTKVNGGKEKIYGVFEFEQ